MPTTDESGDPRIFLRVSQTEYRVEILSRVSGPKTPNRLSQVVELMDSGVRLPDSNLDLRTDDDKIDRRWIFVVVTRTSDWVNRVTSVTVIVTCDESWVS